MKSWEYEHSTFPAGTRVYIVPDIRNIHPSSPVAGKHGIAGKGIAYATIAPFEDQEAKVPVTVDGHEWLVEAAYVMRVGTEEA